MFSRALVLCYILKVRLSCYCFYLFIVIVIIIIMSYFCCLNFLAQAVSLIIPITTVYLISQGLLGGKLQVDSGDARMQKDWKM